MKIQELINELEVALDLHGDIPVYIPDRSTGSTSAIMSVEDAYSNEEGVVIHLLP